MQEKSKNFCCLCGKTKEEPLTKLAVTTIKEFGKVVLVDCCKQCGVVLHNVRRIYTEKRDRCIKEQRKAQQSLIKVVSR